MAMPVRIRRRPDPQRTVDEFNARYPLESLVYLRRDDGEVLTRVRAPAVVMCEAAVAWFDGIRGAYAIENRIRPYEVAGA
jgi:hypothetical protein